MFVVSQLRPSITDFFYQYLFTVNAGSNTVSMFWIDKTDPSHPTLINTAPTLGEFPSSVAYSSKLKTGMPYPLDIFSQLISQLALSMVAPLQA
jgi:uncharacterized membrane protein (UPF0182 family)